MHWTSCGRRVHKQRCAPVQHRDSGGRSCADTERLQSNAPRIHRGGCTSRASRRAYVSLLHISTPSFLHRSDSRACRRNPVCAITHGNARCARQPIGHVDDLPRGLGRQCVGRSNGVGGESGGAGNSADKTIGGCHRAAKSR